MATISAAICAKQLVRWQVAREYGLAVISACIVFALVAIGIIALAVANTPKGQYTDAGFAAWLFVASILICLLAGGVLPTITIRYKAWKRMALAEPSFAEAIVDVLVNRSWTAGSNRHKAVIVVLGDIGNKRATPFLISALQYNDGNIQQKAMEAIGKIGDTIAIEPLIAVLEGILSKSRTKAAETLDKLAWIPRNSTEEAHYLFAKLDWTRLTSLGQTAVKILIKALTNESVGIRMQAANALGTIASTEGHVEDKAVDALIQALDDKSDLVRMRAVRALGVIGAERAVEPLRKASRFYKDSTVVAEAKVALKRILEKQQNDA